jgi:hypothetical protein
MGLITVSDIFTLRPRIGDRSIDLKTAALGQEPRFRYRIRGRTDLGVFRPGGLMGCGEAFYKSWGHQPSFAGGRSAADWH